MHLKVKKFLFVGAEKDREAFYQMAQKAGIIHFDGVKLSLSPQIPIFQAIQVLMSVARQEQEELNDFTETEELVKKINTYKKELEELSEEERTLNLEIQRVSPFGEFDLDDLRYIEAHSNDKFRFFVSKGLSKNQEIPKGLFLVGEEFDLKFYLAIDDGEKEYKDMVEVLIERSLSILLEEKKRLTIKIHETEKELKELAKYSDFLHHAFYFYLNDYNLNKVQNASTPLLNDSLFTSYGFIPVNKIEPVMKIGEILGVYIQEVLIEESDVIPTYLENKGLSKIGEDLISIYDTPGPQDKDPSLWVLCSFALFFAMIVGDAGYGSVYLLLSTYLWYKFPKPSKTTKRLLTLATLLSCTCIIWGVLTNSYFGMDVGVQSPIRSTSGIHYLAKKKAEYIIKHQVAPYAEWGKEFPQIKSAQTGDDVLKIAKTKPDGSLDHAILNSLSSSIMMELALFIGVLHICFSFARYLDKNWKGFGWILAMIGAYLYFPEQVGAITLLQYVFGLTPQEGIKEGLYLLAGGSALAVSLSIIQSGWIGILEIMSPIQIFSDVMSYLRLFALGLAGGILSTTINSMADSMPLVIAIVLMAMAHMINMILGVMSGTIHGLRLNFLEWYHYSFEGGGKPFQALKVMKME